MSVVSCLFAMFLSEFFVGALIPVLDAVVVVFFLRVFHPLGHYSVFFVVRRLFFHWAFVAVAWLWHGACLFLSLGLGAAYSLPSMWLL